MLSLLVLQSALTAAPDLSVGRAITYVGGALGICAAIFAMGAASADTRNLRSTVTTELAAMNGKLDTITRHIDNHQQERVDDAEWKGTMTTRLGTVERELALLNRRRDT